tara:strand:- start:7018 stop:7272 length:255 start_codon:yes stop_codon:yes gene_type:complete
MSGGLEWAAQYEEKQNILKTTSRLQVNLKTWDDADITRFYQDLLIMFQDLKDDDGIALTRRQMRIVDNAWTSFDKIFNTKKNGH